MKRVFAVCAVLSFGAVGAISAYELSPELRADVTELVLSVEQSPTAAENAVERMAVLWRWANAVSKQGGFVPKNISLAAMYVPNQTPGTSVSGRYLAAIDPWIRHLSMLDKDAGALGGVSVEHGVHPAASWQTIRVHYRVGSRGVREGGGLIVSRHALGGYLAPQIDDPADDHYVSISSSREGLRFETDEAPVWGPYGGFRGAVGFPVYRVRGGDLVEGDTLTLVYGDRSGGGRGFHVPAYSNDAIALPLHVDPGDGEFYELPPATFAVVGAEAAGVHGFAPSIVAAGERFEVALRTEDRYYNRASGRIPSYEVRLNGERIGRIPGTEALRSFPVELSSAGVYRISFRSDDGSIEGVANPIWVRSSPRQRIYWGETHGHCGFAEGHGTPEGYFEFARDDASLDFITLSEHDIWLTDGKWKALNDASFRFHREGELLVYPGYEWSAQRQRGGHHNVLYRRPGYDRVDVQQAPNLTDLYRRLREKGYEADTLIIPHAHQAGDWRLSDLDMESLIEIMSSHGTFEWFGQRYLENGFRVGFVGASDNHLGHPGYAPAHPASPVRRSNIFQFGGLAGVFASERTTDAVFDALRARSAYATTGSQRIILDARLNGSQMGTSVPAAEERRIEGRAIGTAPLRAVELVKNGEVIDRVDLVSGPGGQGETAEVVLGFFSESWVDFRDNPRGHRTWKGSITVENASLRSARLLGTTDPTIDVAQPDGNRVSFNVATRGSRRTIALEVEGLSDSTQFVVELEATREMGTAPIQRRRPQRFEASSLTLPAPRAGEPQRQVFHDGAYRDIVTLDLSSAPVLDTEFSFTDRGGPDDYYYVRVEQLDGHRAWSSPWWIDGEPPR